jgi:hypothetical protein
VQTCAAVTPANVDPGVSVWSGYAWPPLTTVRSRWAAGVVGRLVDAAGGLAEAADGLGALALGSLADGGVPVLHAASSMHVVRIAASLRRCIGSLF